MIPIPGIDDSGDYLLFGGFTRGRSKVFILALFAILEIWIVSHPYNVMTMDIADATTNYIWVHLYAHGIFAVPYSQWTYGLTQSVVVLHNGQYFVLNEKGPGFGMLLVPFYLTGTTLLFAPVMVGTAVISTYMLALRIFDWKVAFFAAVIVMLNLSVLAMWSHYYWTDAATMHLLILSVWLLVEANYQFRGKTLKPDYMHAPGLRSTVLAAFISIASGLSFGVAVSTRYPVALVLPALLIYMFAFHLSLSWPYLRKGDYRNGLRKMSGFSLLFPFMLGLLVVLIPLLEYNATYFGSPFSSGYDATTLLSFSHSQALAPRNQSTHWFDSVLSDIGYAGRNFVYLLPLLLLRMPALTLLPFGLWMMRRDKPSLVLFTLWIFIAFYTYLSLSWVVKYDSPRIYLQTVWEPRYFMPAIPPTAILAGIVLKRVTMGREIHNDREKSYSGNESAAISGISQKPAPAIVFMTVVALVSIIPMLLFFAHNGGVIVAPHVRPVTPVKLIAMHTRVSFSGYRIFLLN